MPGSRTVPLAPLLGLALPLGCQGAAASPVAPAAAESGASSALSEPANPPVDAGVAADASGALPRAPAPREGRCAHATACTSALSEDERAFQQERVARFGLAVAIFGTTFLLFRTLSAFFV